MASPKIYKFAGGLPYSINNSGELVFLLGQEHEERGWTDQKKWGLFSGSVDQSDDDIYASAAREMYEESMGFLGEYEEILNKLIKIGEVYEFMGGAVFMYPIKYNEDLPKLFHNVYNYSRLCMKFTQRGKPFIPSCAEGFYEKIEIRWFTMNDIVKEKLNLRRHNYDFFELNVFDNPKLRREEFVVKRFI